MSQRADPGPTGFLRRFTHVKVKMSKDVTEGSKQRELLLIIIMIMIKINEVINHSSINVYNVCKADPG